MKRLLFALLGLIVVCLALALIGPSFIDWNSYKGQAVAEVKKRTGLDLNIDGDIGFAVIPSPRLQLENASLKAPDGSKYEDIVRFDRLDVNVALFPALSGNVDIQSLTLVKPEIYIEAMADGSMNFMTEDLKGQETTAEEQGDAAATKSAGASPAIALNDIRIKDGVFTYYDHKSKNETVVQNINADLGAQDLMGPYEATGSLFVSGNALNFDFTSDGYDQQNSILPAKVKIVLQPSDLAVQYDGVLSFGEEFSAQGQTALRIEKLKGFLATYGIASTAGDDVSLIAKGLLTAGPKKLDFKNAEITKGSEKASGSLSLIYEPLSFDVSIKSDGEMNLQHFVGSALPFQKGALDIALKGDASKMTFDKSTIKALGHQFTLSGSYDATGKRPKVRLGVNAPSVDYDALSKVTSGKSSASGGSGGGSSASDAKSMIKSLALPLDLAVTFTTDSLKYDGMSSKKVKLSANFVENAVDVSELSIGDLKGSAIKVNGHVNDIAGGKGVSAYVDVNSTDIRALADLAKVDHSAWPQNLKSANIKLKLDGSLDQAAVTTNISAMGGEVIAKGGLADPLGKMSLADITLQLKHKNMAQAIKIASGAQLSDASLQKPLDFYAKINQNGSNYKLSDIKGDLSGTTVQGDLFINLGSSVPKITGELDFGKINISSAMDSKGSSGGKSTGAAPAGTSSRWSTAAINTSALKAVNADISLKAKHIDYGSWPISNPSLKITLNNGALDIKDLKGGLFGGSIATDISVRADQTPLTFASDANFNNADLGKLTKAMLGTQLVKISGTGSVAMNIKSAGNSPSALINALNGSGTVSGNEIVLDGVDVTRFVSALSYESKPGDTLTGLWKATTKGGSTAFEVLDGAFTIQKGVVNISKMDLDGQSAAIQTQGQINLPSWYLSTKHKLSVKGTEEQPSDVPPFEMSFEGPLDNPSQTFGQGLLNQYLNNKIQRKLNKLIGDKLGIPSNDNAAPQNNQNGEQQNTSPQQQKSQDPEDAAKDAAKEAIKGLLGDLLR